MKLQLTVGDDHRAVLAIDGDSEKMVVVRCADAVPIAKEIARAVNRDFMFTALVAALLPFTSDEMGQLLIDVVEADTAGGEQAQEVGKTLRKLVRAIDRLLAHVDIEARRSGDG